MVIFLHILIFLILTVLTQIGGIIYLLSAFLVKRQVNQRKLKGSVVFLVLYLLATYLIVPNVAPIFGRQTIEDSDLVRAHSFFYKFANRNYVHPALNDVLQEVAREFEKQNSGIKLMYLDANFPFFDGFPLLPHLSHNDGTKVDVSLMYQTPNGRLTNQKPSVSGYGIYEDPTAQEYDQPSECKEQGYWQYDFPKYLTFGRINREIRFSDRGTRELVHIIASREEISKVFIEPHSRDRLHLPSAKIRFHGCRAVRHDDHIHFQLR